MMYRKFIKPLIDTIMAFAGIIISLPIAVVIMVSLAMFQRGRIFFTQKRPGKHGKVFKLIKFKTMSDKSGPDGTLLSDEDRLTPIGKFIRKTSMDEIPQLLNVLLGQMSFVGPRPLLAEYLSLYNKEQARRHEVKPGITGWAQVNGRNSISWQKRFAYDIYYVDHQSFWLDIKILLLTIKKVFISEGISSATSVTMEKFKGN